MLGVIFHVLKFLFLHNIHKFALISIVHVISVVLFLRCCLTCVGAILLFNYFVFLRLEKLTVFLVDSTVTFKGESITKGRWTNITFVRFLTRVNLCMILQMSSLTEGRTANTAFIRFFTCWKGTVLANRLFLFVVSNSPVWILRWFQRVACLANPLSQTSHTYWKIEFISFRKLLNPLFTYRFLTTMRSFVVLQMWRLRELHSTRLTSGSIFVC